MLERFEKTNSKSSFDGYGRSSSLTILNIVNPSILLLGTALTFNPSAKDALCSLDQLREYVFSLA